MILMIHVGYFEELTRELVHGKCLKYAFIVSSMYMGAYIGVYNSQIVSAQEVFAFLIEANAEQLDEHLPNYFKCLFCYIGQLKLDKKR